MLLDVTTSAHLQSGVDEENIGLSIPGTSGPHHLATLGNWGEDDILDRSDVGEAGRCWRSCRLRVLVSRYLSMGDSIREVSQLFGGDVNSKGVLQSDRDWR